MHLGAIGAVVQSNDQHLQAVAGDRFQFLDVHHQAAIAVDEQNFAALASDGDADCVGKPRTDRAKMTDACV